MEYRSQKIAYWYFAAALPLFVLQVVVGLWLAANYTFTIPQSIVNVFPFSTARAIHTNLLVLWMLLGFMGGTYYIIPEETKSELYSTGLAWFQLIALLATGVTAIVGFLFGWTQGRPLLEIPMALDVVVVIGALVFLFNVGMTMLKAKNWTAIQGTLLGGLVFLALLYLFGIPFYRNLVIDWYYWWWVIHLWVEGAWELVTASIFAFVLMKLTGVERQVVEKWLYVEIGLFLFTGLAGTGHHYYWIGAPKYWLWVGGIFSALEPLPILLMVFDTMHHVKERKEKIVNPLTWTYAIGCAVLHFIGAGVWGFLHTLPQINYYTHGSQVTVSHGHLAFFGAYALLNLMTFYYAMPKMKGIAAYDDRLGKIGFWTMCSAMMIMGLTFGVAGVLQSYIERVLGMGYMVAQGYMRLWMGVTMAGGRLLPRRTAHHRRGPLHVAAGEGAGVIGTPASAVPPVLPTVGVPQGVELPECAPLLRRLRRTLTLRAPAVGTGALDTRQGLRSPGSRTIILRNGEIPDPVHYSTEGTSWIVTRKASSSRRSSTSSWPPSSGSGWGGRTGRGGCGSPTSTSTCWASWR